MVVDISGSDFPRMDQAGVLVHANVDFNSEVPLVTFLGLQHPRLSLPIIVLGAAGCRDQGGFNDRALLHEHTIGLEIGFHRHKDLFAQVVLFQ